VLRLLPPPSVTRHALRLGDGRSLEYVATAGTLPLRDGNGETTAEIFHVAYALEPIRPERPVTFVFNGGPGAASAFLHLGGLGPRMVAFGAEGGFLPPPARLLDNPDTWLDFTDLVFVDPVGTGYSRAAGEGEESERRFFGVRQDASSMAAFIRLWLARGGRALSPVFLAGESYGGFRAAVLAQALPEESGIAPSGLVLISPALEFSLLRGEEYDLLPPAVTLPSLAAVHLERQGLAAGTEAFAARLAEVERFALGDYLVALAAGSDGLTPALGEALARFTGLPAEVVARARGRVSVARFVKEYDRAAGRVLSRYEGALGGPDPDPSSPEPRGPDPVLDRAVPAWTQAFVGYVRGELRYETDVTYRLLSQDVNGKWDYGTGPSRQGYAGALDELQAGRVLNPALEVLVAHGYTDLVTPYLASRYLFGQLPPLAGAAPVTLRTYPGGHMMYTRPESRRALAADARALYGP
jgi:carboxypeptidase C (cathepsin A)